MASACFMTRLMPGEETLSSRAAPPTVPVTMMALMTSIWRNVSMPAEHKAGEGRYRPASSKDRLEE